MTINKHFFKTQDKNLILKNLQFGFRADWAQVMPPVGATPVNFLTGPDAIEKARKRFKEKVEKGRMLGGRGWTRERVENFLGKKVYVIPCGAVPKNGDINGRIIHNYSYPRKNALSVNSALTNTSTEYITFKKRVALLAEVDWYFKADLKNGYRQLPVHPTDWHTQVYSLAKNEYYIDIAMPFGKANSARVFCTWTSAWCKSFKFHFQKHFAFPIALAVYMDDFFGGPIRTGSLKEDLKNAQTLFTVLIIIGAVTSTFMNLKKCEEPARSKEILGMIFNSKVKACFLAATKTDKYSAKLSEVRKRGVASSKELQKIVGYLVYAAWIMPFGRPLISHISHLIDVKSINKKIHLDKPALIACDIWLCLLNGNFGLTFDFILGKLPRQKEEWFVDASKIGFGGVCGFSYFRISYGNFLKGVKLKMRSFFLDMFIAYRELLAVLLAFQVFAKIAPKSLIRINSDNTNVVAWLNKGRCSKKPGFQILAAIEAIKFNFGLKIKAFYIQSNHNNTADALSRNKTPPWLSAKGVEQKIDLHHIVELLSNPLPYWVPKVKTPF